MAKKSGRPRKFVQRNPDGRYFIQVYTKNEDAKRVYLGSKDLEIATCVGQIVEQPALAGNLEEVLRRVGAAKTIIRNGGEDEVTTYLGRYGREEVKAILDERDPRNAVGDLEPSEVQSIIALREHYRWLDDPDHMSKIQQQTQGYDHEGRMRLPDGGVDTTLDIWRQMRGMDWRDEVFKHTCTAIEHILTDKHLKKLRDRIDQLPPERGPFF